MSTQPDTDDTQLRELKEQVQALRAELAAVRAEMAYMDTRANMTAEQLHDFIDS